MSSSSLIRAHTPSPNSVPLGTTTRRPARRASRPAAAACRMMSCRNSSAVSAVCLSAGKLAWMPRLLLAAEGRVGQDHVHALAVADLGQLEAQAVAVVDLRRLQPVQQQVHLRTAGRAAAWPRRRRCCRSCSVSRFSHRLALLLQVLVRLDQEAARAAGRVEHRLAQLRVDRPATMKRTTARGV